MALNNTQVVLLGMVGSGRRTGYEIKRAIDNSTSYFWGASVGGIYPELKRLDEQGLLRSRRDGRRTVYELTAAGDRALHDWLVSDDPGVYELRHEFMLRLFFADRLSPDEALEVVRGMRERHEHAVAQLKALRPHGNRPPRLQYPSLVREFGEEWNEWVVDWCRRTERRLQRQARDAG